VAGIATGRTSTTLPSLLASVCHHAEIGTETTTCSTAPAGRQRRAAEAAGHGSS
jgi:hypothetical protein